LPTARRGFARRLGTEDRVIEALGAAYERWDGKGYPNRIRGDDVPIEIRIAMVARDVDVFVHHGIDVAEALSQRRGKAYAPDVVDAFTAMPGWNVEADWDRVVGTESSEVEDLDLACTVLADFVDLKSPWTRGHSRLVAALARTAALEAGTDQRRVRMVGCAGLVHDIGRVGVENGIWDKPGPLSIVEWEKIRMHPYLTERVLSRCAHLAPLGELASSHHERLDGSGYHRGAGGGALAFDGRLLAAADVLAALLADRPHRPGVDLARATRLMRAEVRSGRLDGRAVECVIGAAGGEGRTVPANPDGLTDREVEVLGLIASGLTNRQAGEQLFISAKTVGRHIENIYAKTGVSTRAGAAVYAMEQQLLN
jgi:HD-GYP domain-containing protein (c-di-GMP phosphodiesterase class II)